jgi:hypothetical protein
MKIDKIEKEHQSQLGMDAASMSEKKVVKKSSKAKYKKAPQAPR